MLSTVEDSKILFLKSWEACAEEEVLRVTLTVDPTECQARMELLQLWVCQELLASQEPSECQALSAIQALVFFRRFRLQLPQSLQLHRLDIRTIQAIPYLAIPPIQEHPEAAADSFINATIIASVYRTIFIRKLFVGICLANDQH